MKTLIQIVIQWLDEGAAREARINEYEIDHANVMGA